MKKEETKKAYATPKLAKLGDIGSVTQGKGPKGPKGGGDCSGSISFGGKD